ncbi:MAG: hypothetical protein KBD78_07090 [Oligoflexales bacterium]|nr:hypothetical protein [Oligoflexales bacterium]
MNNKKISRLLIANRGEIARRIAQSAKKLNITPVVILCDDEKIPIYLYDLVCDFYREMELGTKVFLNSDQLIQIAKKMHCDAIHPGFGFLSENAAFAAAVIKAKLIWIGPKPDSIEKMASKSKARDLAKAAGVPCINGLQNLDVKSSAGLAKITKFCDDEGLPVLVKAAYGGGGKGMRIIREKTDLFELLPRAESEALNSFGNGSLIIEKYLENPRHIEVQVLGDSKGNVIALGDRDCSMQRRHQKIIEEAPAPFISEEIRQELHKAAINLARSVNYESAGTIEFLYTKTTHSENSTTDIEKIYFLEMNTRLQVEHPVTEEIFGLDLVEWQLRIASGEKLSEEVIQARPRGHAIEVRIYAEDVNNNFFPSPGEIYNFNPAYGPGIRWEIGIDSQDKVSEKYDPMVAKLIAYAANREDACSQLNSALQKSCLFGVHNNLEFLQALLSQPNFLEFNYSTHYIDKELGNILERIRDNREMLQLQAETISKEFANAFDSQNFHYRTLSSNSEKLKNIFQKNSSRPRIGATPLIQISSYQTCKFGTKSVSSGWARLTPTVGENPEIFQFTLVNDLVQPGHEILFLNFRGKSFEFTTQAKDHWVNQNIQSDSSNTLQSPVPAKVIKILCQIEENVSKGAKLFILESMKMEYEILAPRSTKIKNILVDEGLQVSAGQNLATFFEELPTN